MTTDIYPSLCLLVLKSPAVEAARAFYESIGIRFESEQHGSGPLHYSAQLGATVLELYPLGSRDGNESATRLGFNVNDLALTVKRLKDELKIDVTKEPQVTPWGIRAVVRDPDGRSVELYERATKEHS